MQPRFIQFVVYSPWKTLFTCLILVLSIGYFLKDVAPSVSYKDMLGEDYPLLKSYERMQRDYTNDDNLLVLIEATDHDAFTPQTLGAVKQLTQDLWQTPYSVRVDSLTNFQHTEAVEDDLRVGDLVPESGLLDNAILNKIKQVALNEPQLLNRVVNPEANVLAINVSFAFPNKNLNEKLDADGFVQTLAEKFRQKNVHTKVYVAGLVALDATVMKISQQESGLFLVLILAIIILLLMCLMRSVKPLLIIIMVVLFSVIAGMAFSGLMGWKLTPFTASVPMMILVLAVADSVHFVSAFLHNLRLGNSKHKALEKALELNLKPIAITSITTAIGFMTLNFSESESIGALGSQVAFGVMFAFFLSVSLLPAMLSVTPIRARPGLPFQTKGWDKKMASMVCNNKGSILLISFVLCSALTAFIPNNEFNDSLPTYFAKTLPWRQANDFSESQFGGAYTFSYALSTQEADGIANPLYLKKVHRFVDWLRSKPEVAHVSSITDTFKRLNRSMHGDDVDFYRLPETRPLAAQYLLLYEMSLPYGLDLNNQVNLDKSASKIIVTFRTLSTKRILQLEQEIAQWLATNVPNVQVEGTGVQMMFAHLLDSDTKGLIWGAALGLLLISLLLILAFKSVRFGLVSILPNLAPVALAFGIWGLLVGQVGMGMAMVSGITIGVVVDDTVHFLHKYISARRNFGMSTADAIEYAYRHAGMAIILTTLVLVAGFMSMALLSEFRVNSDMGKMACIVMTAALIVDLLTLPALLALIDKKNVIQSDMSPILTKA